jgi:hypothetical protein
VIAIAAPRVFRHAETTAAHTAFVRFVSVQTVRLALAAGAVVVFAGIVGCSDDRKPEITKITFDGKTYEIDGYVSCVRQLDGGLVIDAPVPPPWSVGPRPGGGKKLIRVELLEDPRLVIETAALRFDDVRGFTDASDDMWGTKVDDVYTINGRMRGDGAQWHQFKIEVICSYIDSRYVTRRG